MQVPRINLTPEQQQTIMEMQKPKLTIEEEQALTYMVQEHRRRRSEKTAKTIETLAAIFEEEKRLTQPRRREAVLATREKHRNEQRN